MKNIPKKHLLISTLTVFTVTTLVCIIFKSILPLAFIAFTVFFLLIMWEPLIGLCLMIFFIPLENITILFPSFTLIKLTGIITCWSWLMHIAVGKKELKFPAYMFLVIIYLSWALLSALWALDSESSLARMVSLGQLALMIFLGYNLVDKKKKIYFILGSYLAGAVLSSCIGIYNAYLHDFAVRTDISSISDPNFYARLTGLGFIICIYFFMNFKDIIWRSIALLSSAIIIPAVLLSGSRGAWLALLAVICTAILLSAVQIFKTFKNKPVTLIATVVSLILFFVFLSGITGHLPEVITHRAQSFTQLTSELDRGSGRLDIWLVGLEVAKNNLATGVGLSNFPYAFTEYYSQVEGVKLNIGLSRDPHNIFLATLSELGLPGLALLLLMLFYMWKAGNRTAGRADSLLCKLLPVFLAVGGLTSTDHCSKFFWFSMMVPCILAQYGILKDLPSPGRKIKTIYLSPVFPNRKNLNDGNFSHRFAQSLIQRNTTMVIIAPLPYSPPLLWLNKKWLLIGRVPPRDNLKDITVHHPRYLCLPGGKFNEWNAFFMYLAIFNSVSVLKNEAGFNIIHSYGLLPAGYAGTFCGKKLNLPAVCTAIGTDINVSAIRSSISLKQAEKTLQYSKVAAVSRDLAGRANNLPGADRQVKVIYEGIDSSIFYPLDQNESKKTLGFTQEEKLILYVGRLIREKGVYELLEAFARITGKYPEARLVYAGKGIEKISLENLASQKGILNNVTLAGEISHKNLTRWYSASEAIALLSYSEGLPNVIKEAMSCGKPVIATDTGGIPELVENSHSGFLITPGNIEQAAESLEKIIADPGLGKKMGMCGREILALKNLDWGLTAYSYRKIYSQLIK